MVVHDQVCRRDGTNGRTYDVTGLIGRSRICKKNILEEVGNNNSTAKGMNLKILYKTNKTQFLKGSTHERKTAPHLHKTEVKTKTARKTEERMNIGNPARRKDFWRIEESVTNILIWTIRFLLHLTNIIKYKVILSAEIRWKYVYTLLLPLLPFSAVFPSRQISNILPFYRFFRSRGFGFRLR